MAKAMVAQADEIVVGVDTHGDIHVAVVLSGVGARLGSISVPTTPPGFAELMRWAEGFGRVRWFRGRGHRQLRGFASPASGSPRPGGGGGGSP